MDEKRRIMQELETLITLKNLALAEEEIAMIKIRLARGSVLATRDFLNSLAEVFYNVKSSYTKHVISQMEKNKEQNKPVVTSTIPNNGKDLLVFLSANNKLYGDIIPKIFARFREEYNKANTDIVIVGKVGKQMYEQAGLTKPYTYFEIADSEKRFEDLKPLIQYIVQYKNVIVFYGKFTNIITQNPSETNISGDYPFETQLSSIESATKTGKEYGFIFEPSIEKVMNFFETQMLFSLFKQTVHEAELSRYGSRIHAMEAALVRVNADITTETQAEKRMKNLLQNKKQLERISGISLWRR